MSANAGALTSSFKKEILEGGHAFGAQPANAVRTVTTKDTFYAALFVTGNSMGAATTVYSTSGEVTNGSGSGYTAGGLAITNANAPSVTSGTAHWTPSASLVWTAFTSAAPFDCCLIYNYTATAVNAVGTFVFGAQSITSGTFTLTMPVDDNSTGLVRIA